MKKSIFITIVLVMLGWAVYEFISSSNEQSSEGKDKITAIPENDSTENNAVEVEESDEIGTKKGELAPDFELTTLDGEQVKLSDYKGERVMLNFWATWCPPCRAEMPDMEKFQQNKDVQVLAVNLTETEASQEAVENFADELGVTFTIPLDEDYDVAMEYGVMAYPTTYMIDSNGRIQFVMMGAMNYENMVQQFEMMQ